MPIFLAGNLAMSKSMAMVDNDLLPLAMMLKASGYRFTTVTPATHARVNARLNTAWANNVTEVLGWSRPFKQGVIPQPLFEALQGAGMLHAHGDGFKAQVRASTLQQQLFLHSAYPTMAEDAIFFGPDTYRFANAIARTLQANVPVQRAVDIGCGAGAGAVVVALARPEAQVFAVDINDTALAYTAVNARVAGAKCIVTQQSNLLNDVEGDFDLIVANPPYLLDTHERRYRHGGGSFGEGLSLAIVALAKTRLAVGGTLLLYTGSAIVKGQDLLLEAITPLLDDMSLQWHYEELDPDVFGEELTQPAYIGVDRIAAVLLSIQRKAL